MAMNFRIPGPTPLPPQVVAALGHEMISHRGPAFQSLYRETLGMARLVHRTETDVLTWPASGSAGWELAVVNLFSPGDSVLAVINGDFGERFARVATRFGLDVRRLEVPWGAAVAPDALAQSLEENPETAGVLVVYNETSTGVTNPLAELAAVAREHRALVIVDAVSAAGAIPLEVDAWGIDLVFSGSQKAWMCPPGLLIVAVGPRAWEAYERSHYPKSYWDLGEARRMAERGMTPTTPPLSLMFAFHAALQMILEEGLEIVWERHRHLGAIMRDEVTAAGLDLFAQRGFESNSVTAFCPPEGVRASSMLTMLREDYCVEAQGGQAHLADRLIRVGHMGWAHEADIRQAATAVQEATVRLRESNSRRTTAGAGDDPT
jgi:aspartate aminotransferase-like enzyme